MGCISDLSLQKQSFPDPHVIHFKPITVLNKTASSQRGSLGGPPWDAFLPYRSTTNFSGSPYNPFQAVYSFEQYGFIPTGVLRGTSSELLSSVNEVCLHAVYMMPSVWIHSVCLAAACLEVACLDAVCVDPVSLGLGAVCLDVLSVKAVCLATVAYSKLTFACSACCGFASGARSDSYNEQACGCRCLCLVCPAIV